MQLLSNQSLRAFNTFGIDCVARHFAEFNTEEDLTSLLDTPEVKKNKRLILGGGSNLLFTQPFDGVVLKNNLQGIELVKEDNDHYFVRAQAGENWHSFVMHCIDRNYAGIENLSLIPGCVGASPMQNIGAYGVEIKDVFHRLEAIHIEDKHKHTFELAECSFGYRESIFKNKEKNNWVITNVTFKLDKRARLKTGYGAIEEELDKMHLDQITIKDVSKAVIQIRSSKLPDPKILGNAGSFFKNPVVPIDVYQSIQKEWPTAPAYPISEHEVKVPAGWLIEQAGWKGKKRITHGVHDKQALVLVNFGDARGQEILQLSTDIIEDIQSKFNITLEREVNIY
jgi:UDP-N-acetylmuramate dehydrogenase